MHVFLIYCSDLFDSVDSISIDERLQDAIGGEERASVLYAYLSKCRIIGELYDPGKVRTKYRAYCSLNKR